MINWIRRVINNLFAKQDIKDALNIDVAISEDMDEAISLWSDMYEDRAYWIDNANTHSLNLPSSIANEISRLVTLEVRTEVIENEKLNEAYQNVVEDLKEITEYAAAKGGLMLKPYLDGDRVLVDYVQAGMFFPTEYDSSGEITGCIFIDRRRVGSNIYTRLENHEMLEGGYKVSHHAYKSMIGDEESLGSRVPLTEVRYWADLEEEIFLKGVEIPLFSYFKIPLANTIDSKSPLGTSVFARAANLIREADKQYSRILWEYEGSELAINASGDLFKGDGTIPTNKERLYRKLDTDSEDFFEEWAPSIRDESLYNGLNKLLQRIEFASGLAYGTLSDVQLISKTATEVKASKQRTYSTVLDIQKSLERALVKMVDIFIIWSDLANLGYGNDPEISFEWDDSVVVDMDEEYSLMLREISAGILKPEYYLQRRYGIPEEEALKLLPDDYYQDEAEEDWGEL